MGVFDGLASWLFGADPISDSNVKQQEALLQQQSAQYAAREQQDYQRQLGYGQMLQNQIAGTGAPSVAQRQLVAGLDQQNRNQASQVAGASGSNAALANYGAMLQAGQAGAQMNQQQAVLRAQEIQSAQNQLGGLYSSMGQRSMGGYGTALGGAQNYAGMATSIAQANQRAQMAATGTLLSTAGTLGAAALGGPAAGAVGTAAGNAGAAYSAAQPGYAASQQAGYGGATPNAYSAAQPGYGASLTAGDQPQDPYQSSYSNGVYNPPRAGNSGPGQY
jgi:hypothetical protein